MNMRNVLLVAAMSAAAGCMTSSVQPPAEWNIESVSSVVPMRMKAVYGVAKLMLVEVRAPYAVREVAVLRADGSVAFDPCNSYAAAPVQLAKWVAAESLAASGLFEDVVTAGSSADAEVEVSMKRLALDCREPGSCRAVSEVSLRLVRSHAIVAHADGAGMADASGRDFSAAFSKAVTAAFADALGRLAQK